MKIKRFILIVAAIVMTVDANAQRSNRTDLCHAIPNLSLEQQKKIDKLSTTHQKTMDELRTKFYAEPDVVKASGFKIQMNTEMKSHYQNISGLLTSEQQTWFDQNCNVNNRRAAFGRGQGLGRNQTYVRGQAYSQGRGYGRGRGYARGQGRFRN